MDQVELFERSAVALLATLDEPPDVSGRVPCGARSSPGGFVGHQR
jgi:hypothetical protein